MNGDFLDVAGVPVIPCPNIKHLWPEPQTFVHTTGQHQKWWGNIIVGITEQAYAPHPSLRPANHSFAIHWGSQPFIPVLKCVILGLNMRSYKKPLPFKRPFKTKKNTLTHTHIQTKRLMQGYLSVLFSVST